MTAEEFKRLIRRWHLTPALITAVTGLTVDQQKNYRFSRTRMPATVDGQLRRLAAALEKIRETN